MKSQKEKQELIASMKLDLFKSIDRQIKETAKNILEIGEGDTFGELLAIAEPQRWHFDNSELGSAINEEIVAELLNKSKSKLIESQDFAD
ncbi:hypothetical protein [Enterococcus larvae]|uniref:hypothetical protein n=1 Tax=Enterococcus larvae TaxID=2794352 RepID=UPI003F2D6100